METIMEQVQTSFPSLFIESVNNSPSVSSTLLPFICVTDENDCILYDKEVEGVESDGNGYPHTDAFERRCYQWQRMAHYYLSKLGGYEDAIPPIPALRCRRTGILRTNIYRSEVLIQRMRKRNEMGIEWDRRGKVEDDLEEKEGPGGGITNANEALMKSRGRTSSIKPSIRKRTPSLF